MACDNSHPATPDVPAYFIDPWGGAPNMKSRITGLGGSKQSLDPACVFKTAGLRFEPGQVKLFLEVLGFSGGTAFMFLDLTNASIAVGSPPVRLQLTPVELQPGSPKMQFYQMEFWAHSQISYQLAGYIHGDVPLTAESITITCDHPFSAVNLGVTEKAASKKEIGGAKQAVLERATRICDLIEPDFRQMHSQPSTADQLSDPDFLRWQASLFGSAQISARACWPEAYVMRVAETYGILDRSFKAIGFDAADGKIWTHLLKRGQSVLLADRVVDPAACIDLGAVRDELSGSRSSFFRANPLFDYTVIDEDLPKGYRNEFHFAWWVTNWVDNWSEALRGILKLADSLSDHGLAVAVFPIHFNDSEQEGSVSAKTELPRILIDVLSFGHQLVQVRLMPETRGIKGVVSMGIILNRGGA